MSNPIIIAAIPPKYITIKAGGSDSSNSQRSDMSDDSCGNEVLDEFLVRGKKRRLDHLTWEEKLQRKKLKNRVAAQTSRDRKKAKIDDMDNTIQLQSEKISTLEIKCNRLQQEKHEITNKYTELERRFDELKQRLDAQDEQNRLHAAKVADVKVKTESRSIGCGTNELYGSAVSFNPLPKGSLDLQSILCHSSATNNSSNNETGLAASLWKIIALCLVYKSCSTSGTSISGDWKNLPKAYSQMSPQNWKTIFEKVSAQMPKVMAAQSDSLNQWWGPQQQSWNPAKISVAH